MKKIYLVRHGESLAQTGECKEDDLNPGLSPLGVAQAKRLNPLFEGFFFDRIIISTLQRAIQTYQYAGPKGNKAVYDSRLIEGDYGIADYYLSIKGLSATLPAIAGPDLHNAYLVPPATRVVSLIDDLLASPDKTFLLFGHFGIFGLLLNYFLGISTDDKISLSKMDNTSISLLEVHDDGKRSIGFWNERAHVISPKSPFLEA